jgi:hypothetical protein
MALAPPAISRQQHDPGAPDVLLRAVAIPHDSFQPSPTVAVANIDIPFRINQPRTNDAVRYRNESLPLGAIH